ncbi:uncharacterized protein LOC118736854 isoform X1 [Rhagoletis pomonella]|uniref:uncharacterized protein LOC118736854 isoform X1 n=1 Tax=Rhagoletis pomonella TaxID=28610 RepID=UPI00177B3CAA|nr:uncharacterized protein LOC118736854 isoform X1 [Rhagoletis pomonella]
MVPPAKKIKKSYITWSSSERRILLERRIDKDVWFSSKNANSNEGWKKIANELKDRLDGKSAEACKAQWNALMKKYKSFFKYRSGDGTGEEATAEEAKDWEFFDCIHSYASKKDNFHPPFLIDSGDGEVSMQPRREENATFVSALQPVESLTNSQSTSSEESRQSPLPSTSRRSAAQNGVKQLERHIYKRDKKINKKISTLLAVFGQMVQTDYPHIDASALLLTSDSDSE